MQTAHRLNARRNVGSSFWHSIYLYGFITVESQNVYALYQNVRHFTLISEGSVISFPT